MSNKNDAYASTEYIRDLSHAKLSQYVHSSKDASIRKFVLITNMLRHHDNKMSFMEDDALEQQWLDTCLDELEKEEVPPAPAMAPRRSHCESDDFREAPKVYILASWRV